MLGLLAFGKVIQFLRGENVPPLSVHPRQLSNIFDGVHDLSLKPRELHSDLDRIHLISSRLSRTAMRPRQHKERPALP
jgi:hypothetical protein